MTFIKSALIAAGVGLAATSADAAVVYQSLPATAQQASPGSLAAVFNAGAGAGSATFDINGYLSLDGDGNCCTDVFTLNLNGTDIFSGSFALGGGGNSVVYFGPAGSTAASVQFSFFGGGIANIFVPLTLAAGSNTLTFTYSGAAQGLGDEAWGLQNVVVEGSAAVPEPASWALLIAGFVMVGASVRRRRAVAAVAA